MDEKKIEDTLLSIGITPNLKGFYCIKYVMLAYEEESNLIIKTIDTYNKVAKFTGEQPQNVERQIRHSVCVAKECNTDTFKEIFHVFHKITNSVFLSTLYLYIKRKVEGQAKCK